MRTAVGVNDHRRMRRSQPTRSRLAPLGAVTKEIAGAMAVVSQMALLSPPGF
jgi:hypothetical protein